MPLGRREFLLGGAALPGLSSQFSYAAQKKKKTGEPRPNILLIVADGVGSWMLGCGGNTQIHTPNIDLLAKGGTRFAENFVYQPSPSPSRVTLLTGRPQGSPADPMLFDVLAGEGYNCGFCGRWDMSESSSPLHHNAFWQPLAGLPVPVTAKAIEFLDQQSASKPFFLSVGYSTVLDGHAPKYYELYAKSNFEAMGRDPASPNAAAGKEMLKDVVANIRKAAAATTALDDQIPQIVAKLHERNLDASTLIVFTSASGSLLGRHGLWGDGNASDPVNMYDEVVAVPMIWNWAGRVPVEGVRNELVSLYDFLPSVCEAAGAAAPPNIRGRSYATVALGGRFPKKQPWRNIVYGRYKNTAMVRDSRYKLVTHEKGQTELYDLNLDARERVNRAAAPSYISIRETLTRQLASAS